MWGRIRAVVNMTIFSGVFPNDRVASLQGLPGIGIVDYSSDDNSRNNSKSIICAVNLAQQSDAETVGKAPVSSQNCSELAGQNQNCSESSAYGRNVGIGIREVVAGKKPTPALDTNSELKQSTSLETDQTDKALIQSSEPVTAQTIVKSGSEIPGGHEKVHQMVILSSISATIACLYYCFWCLIQSVASDIGIDHMCQPFKTNQHSRI